MDLKPFLTENFSSPLVNLSTLIFLLIIIKQTKKLFTSNIQNLPPGPPKLPIIGNLHQIGDKVHVSLANIAQEYGGLISLKLGSKLLVVASTPEAAMGVLKTQDRCLSSRSMPSAYDHEAFRSHSVFFLECNETWRNLRAIVRNGILSPQALEAHSSIRVEKVDRMLSFLKSKQGEVINAQDITFSTLYNIMSCIVFGKDLVDIEKENRTLTGAKASLYKVLEFGARTTDFGEFFPILYRLDLQGIRKVGLKHTQDWLNSWKESVEDRRAQKKSTTWSSEQPALFVDPLIDAGYTNEQMAQYLAELYAGISNTTNTSLVWLMTELVRNPEIRKKVEEEIDTEFKTDKVSQSRLSNLPYLKACIKETFRLHAPAPYLLPRLANQTCEVMNYTIPKDAKVLVNVWALGRDPKVWDDPLSFKPERFVGSTKDFKGHDFDLLPFGSGRRMCPGVPLGSLIIEYIVASLIHEFEWVLPNNEDPKNLDMNEVYAMTLKKQKPLELFFKSKRGSSTS